MFDFLRRRPAAGPDSDDPTQTRRHEVTPPPAPEPAAPKEEDDLAARITEQVAAELAGQIEAMGESITASLRELIAKASKEQLRANAIAERALNELRAVRPVPLPDAKDTHLIEALMPVLDAIEAGIESGETQLDRLKVTVGGVVAYEILSGWLDGQRLLRERLLSLLERESVRPIPAVGQLFDPFKHVAVETVYDPRRAHGTIVEERRRGYELFEGTTGRRVLRFAEVVVTKDQRDAIR